MKKESFENVILTEHIEGKRDRKIVHKQSNEFVQIRLQNRV